MPEVMDIVMPAAGFLVGSLLGAIYFGGLWWTVRKIHQSQRPLSLYFGSLFARLAVVLGGLFLMLKTCDWPALVAAMVGFLVVRAASVRFARQMSPEPSAKETA
jgi:F1F0 ATPase subunit 2